MREGASGRRPTVAEVREVGQPPAVMGRRNAEHWTGELYMRRLSPYVTRELVRTPVTANGVTWVFVVTGWLAAVALLVPGVAGVVLAALLAQLQMLLDCVDGEVARWRRTSSPAGVFLDKLGHYTTEAGVALALGLRADGVTLTGGWTSTGGWTTLGALLALLVVINKALNDMVHVARAHAGLERLPDTAEATAPRPGLVAAARRLARFVPFHRLYHSIELTLIALAAGVLDAVLGSSGDPLPATRALVVVLVPACALTVVGHTAAILTSRRLRA